MFATGSLVKGYTLYHSSHHDDKRSARVRDLLPRLLTQRPDPPGPPLQPHLLRTLPGENVQGRGCHLQRLLPPVPLDYLHPGQPHPARRPVGQHGNLGPDRRGGDAAEEARIAGGFQISRETAHKCIAVSISLKTSSVFLKKKKNTWSLMLD